MKKKAAAAVVIREQKTPKPLTLNDLSDNKYEGEWFVLQKENDGYGPTLVQMCQVAGGKMAAIEQPSGNRAVDFNADAYKKSQWKVLQGPLDGVRIVVDEPLTKTLRSFSSIKQTHI